MEDRNTHEVFFTTMDLATQAAWAMVTLQYDMEEWTKECARYQITRWANENVEGSITHDFDQQLHNPNYAYQGDPPLCWRLIIEKIKPSTADFGGCKDGMR